MNVIQCPKCGRFGACASLIRFKCVYCNKTTSLKAKNKLGVLLAKPVYTSSDGRFISNMVKALNKKYFNL